MKITQATFSISQAMKYLNVNGLFLSTKITHETTNTQLRVSDKHMRIVFIQVLREPCCARGIFFIRC